MQFHLPDRQRSSGWRLDATRAVLALACSAPMLAMAAEPGFTVTGGSIFSYRTGNPAASVEALTQNNAAPSVTSTQNYTTTGAPYLEVQLPVGSTDGWASLKQSVTSWQQSSFSDQYTASAALAATASPTPMASTNYAWFGGTISYENSSLIGQPLSLSVVVAGSYPVAPSLPGLPSLPSLPAQPSFLISTDGGSSFTTLVGSMSFAGGSYTATATTSVSAGSFLLYAMGSAAMSSYSLSIDKSWSSAPVQLGTSVQTLSTTVIPAQPVPEPREWMMLLAGLFMTGMIARRRLH